MIESCTLSCYVVIAATLQYSHWWSHLCTQELLQNLLFLLCPIRWAMCCYLSCAVALLVPHKNCVKYSTTHYIPKILFCRLHTNDKCIVGIDKKSDGTWSWHARLASSCVGVSSQWSCCVGVSCYRDQSIHGADQLWC